MESEFSAHSVKTLSGHNLHDTVTNPAGNAAREVIDAHHIPSVEEQVMDRCTAEEIHQILHSMPEPFKEVFMLKVFGSLEFKQIAALFQKSESWAKMTYYRGKSKIIQELEERNGNH